MGRISVGVTISVISSRDRAVLSLAGFRLDDLRCDSTVLLCSLTPNSHARLFHLIIYKVLYQGDGSSSV